MIKTKTSCKRALLILTTVAILFTVFVSNFPKASAAVTYSFNVIRTLNVDSTAPYSAYGLKENVTIGNGGTVKGGYNWSVLLLKTSNGYEPAYCVEPSKSVADCTYSEKNMSYSADTKNKLGAAFLYCFTGAYNSVSDFQKNVIENHDNMCRYLATQLIVWEIVCNCNLVGMCNKFTSSAVCTNVRKYYDSYKSAISAHNKELDSKVFFSTEAEANKHIVKDDSIAVKTFTDSNLKNFRVDKVTNGKANISGSKLSVTPEAGKTAVVHLVQSNTSDLNYRCGYLTAGDGNHQTIAAAKSVPMEAYIAVAGQETGGVAIIKKSSDGNVANIKFSIKSADGSYKKSAATDKNGKLNFPDLKAGTYTVTEEMTAGMALQYNSTKSKTVVVKAGQTASVTFVNTKYTGHISVNKYSEDGKIEGVEFALCRYILDDNGNESMDSFYDTKFTDENGYVEWNNLPAYDKNGDEYFYWVAEDHVPPQYAKVQFYIGEYDEIKVDDGQSSALTFAVFGEDISLTAVNTLKRSEIEIYKKDVETKQVIPIAGAEFQIYDSNGDIVTLTDDDGNHVTTFVTDKTGCAKLPEPLVYGEYTLVEIKAPEGYVIDKTPVKFAVTKDGATVIVEKKNSEQKGKINIVKTGNIFKSVEGGDTYTPVFEDSGLKGAAFDIIAVSDIFYPNGEIRIKSGTIVDSVVTDKNGEAETKELYLGDYKAVETAAPNGYIRDKSEYLVSLTYGGQEVSVTSSVMEAYNHYEKISVIVSKFMEEDVDFGIYKNDYVQYVNFGLFANENITAVDGTVIPKDGLIEEIGLSADMTAVFNKNLPFGKYYVKEMTTDEHYIISDEKYEFEFSYQGDKVPTVMIKTEEFVNNLKRGSVNGLKIDAEDKSNLSNAVIGLFMGDETEFSESSAILTDISDSDGSFRFNDIPYGVYQIKEIKPPEGYILIDKVFPVTINENGQVIEITIDNEKIRGNVEVKKYDSDADEKLSGAIFTLYKDGDSDGNFNPQNDVTYGTLNESDGIYSINGVEYGDYLLKETKAPSGYVIDNEYYSVKIRDNGKTIIVSNDKSEDKFYNFPIKGNVQVNKYDRDTDEKLSGAEFTVYFDDSEEVFGVLSETETGVYTLSDIPYGKYTIAETKAPEGYILDSTRYPFEITSNGQTEIISNSDSKDRFNNAKITTTTTAETTITTNTTTTVTTTVSETTPEETTTFTDITTPELTTSVTEITTTISETVPFKESSPHTGDTRHTTALIAGITGLAALAVMIISSRKRN